MAKRRKKNPDARSPPSDGTRRAVYADSSLNTHILLHVSVSDTVTDLRKKLVHEHLKCFPAFGKIIIHSLKVKRSGCFYHLAESMPVCCAFEGFKKFWFLSVDASCSKGQSSFQSLGLDPITNGKGFVQHPNIDLADPEKESVKNQRNAGFSVELSHLQKVTENDHAFSICNDSSGTALGAKFVPDDEDPLCQQPQKMEPQKVPASIGIDTNGIAGTTANKKSNTSEQGVKNGPKKRRKRKRPTKLQSRDPGIHASVSTAFLDSSNTDMHGAEMGCEDKSPSNDKFKRRKLSTDHDISSQDAADRRISKAMVKDFKNFTRDEGPKVKSVAVNPNLSSMEDEICKGKIAIDEAHKVVLLENFNPSYQNDINGHVKEGTSLAELIGTNKGKESKKSNNGKKLKKPTKGFVEVQSDALAIDNKTDEKIKGPNEKDHKIMLYEDVGAELHIKKVVDDKELGQIGASVMVNDNLLSESFLPDHTDKTYEKEELQGQDDPDKQIKELVGSVELISTNKTARVVVEDMNSTKAGLSSKLPDKVINSNLNKVNEATTSSRSNHRPEVAKAKKRSSLGFSSSGIQFQGPSSKVEPKSNSESHKLNQIKRVPEEAGLTDSNGLAMRKSPARASLEKNIESSNKNTENSSSNVDGDVSKAPIYKIGENKSLFGRSGTIFEVTSSESSMETEYSSTESPADSSSSLSSESSDSSNLRSNECFGSKGKEHKNEVRTPGTEKLSLDMVLKRSSRFKKAKLALIKCRQHEEADSQVVGIVPDSEDIVPDSDED